MTQSFVTNNRFTRRSVTIGLGAAGLAACVRAPRTQKDADVIVVGAGLSGLFSALWLSDAGYRVIVVEASERIGGRMWTLDDVPGKPEAGGSQVGQSYARIRYAAERTGVRILDEAPAGRGDRLLSLGGQPILQSNWATSPANMLPETFKRSAPDAALFAAAAPKNTFDWPGAWRTDSAFSIDQSAEAFLKQSGFDDASRALIDVALNANTLDSYSMINLWRSLQLFSQDRNAGPTGYVEGGAQRLPEAMAASLSDGVKTNFRVQSITEDNNGVAISNGGDQLRADFCIIALPFPAVAKLAIDPAPQGAQAAAITGLPQTQILQLHLEPEDAFWERDGLPASMWSDGPLERVFATKDRESDNIVGLLSWINGTRAIEVASASDEELERLAQEEIARLRPASEGKVRLRKAVRWLKGQSYAGGAYMHWAPGQAEKWALAMGAPHGRIHFAGEHLSHLHTGMEGAMEAGQNAAASIIEATQ